MEIPESFHAVVFRYHVGYSSPVKKSRVHNIAAFNKLIEKHDSLSMRTTDCRIIDQDDTFVEVSVFPRDGNFPDLDYIDQEICIAFGIAGYRRV